MVLKMLTDTREFRYKLNACCGKNVLGTDTTVEQHCWTSNCATCQNHLLFDLDCGFTGSSITGVFDRVSGEIANQGGRIEKKSGNMCIGKDIVVRSWSERVEIAGTTVRSRPVGWVDGGSRHISTPVVTAVRVGGVSDGDVLGGGRPLCYHRKCAEYGELDEVDGSLGTYKPGHDIWIGPLVPWLEESHVIAPPSATSWDGGVKVSLFFIAAKKESHVHFSAPFISPNILFHALISISPGRFMYMPLMAELPV
jgi:hypothetical protein